MKDVRLKKVQLNAAIAEQEEAALEVSGLNAKLGKLAGDEQAAFEDVQTEREAADLRRHPEERRQRMMRRNDRPDAGTEPEPRPQPHWHCFSSAPAVSAEAADAANRRAIAYWSLRDRFVTEQGELVLYWICGRDRAVCDAAEASVGSDDALWKSRGFWPTRSSGSLNRCWMRTGTGRSPCATITSGALLIRTVC